MSVGQALVTADEFLQITEQSDTPLALIRGEVKEMSRVGKLHGIVCGKVAYFLLAWCTPGKCGWVMTNDVGVLTERTPDSVRRPDVLFIRAERLPDPSSGSHSWLTIPPDLCVEVLSPNDRRGEVVSKIDDYLTMGVPEVWMLDPEKKLVQIHVADGDTLNVLQEGDTLSGCRDSSAP